MANKQKQISDVLGVQTKCVNYEHCPMCYGCRAYRPNVAECNECAKEKKKNICNTDLHKAEHISKLITKNRIKLDGEIKFESSK